MRLLLAPAVIAGMLVCANSQAAQFTIVSGDLHAQATLSGVPPTKDNPADVLLGPGLSSGAVQAKAAEQIPGDPSGSFSTSGGDSLNSSSFSFAGHGNGNGGALLQPTGDGSGSIDLIFALNSPAQVHFVGSSSIGSLPNGFTATASLTSNGSVITSFPFTTQGLGSALDFVQTLNAGSYELSASGTVTGGVLEGNGNESVTMTIVPDPVSVGLAMCGAVGVCRVRRKRPVIEII